jgi:hypothetical protein
MEYHLAHRDWHARTLSDARDSGRDPMSFGSAVVQASLRASFRSGSNTARGRINRENAMRLASIMASRGL